ncbi:ABC transporter permease [Microvirga sesbaniae]|uniref:ABC transporter permease n=1 Tax=Microvirga sesbaniae TaxID=681392 RepID=UPI0021C95F1A|nr:ABC transporter permease [Microvirga sp. HBU67692]
MSINHLAPSAPTILEPARSTEPSSVAQAIRFIRQRHWSFAVGSLLFLTIAVLLIISPWIIPHDPSAQSLLRRLAGPSVQHWLGTDHLGRDLLSRLLIGGRFSVVIAAVTLILGAVIGTLLGVISARTGGLTDEIIMRVVDLLISFPDVIVAIFMIAIFGPGYGTLIASLTIVGWTPFARMARGLTLEINSREYIKAAEVLGCTKTFIIFRHVIPNAIRPIAAISFLRFGHKLITVGGLSFLGLGVQPPNADWALMLAESQPFVERAPLLVFAPGLAIFLTALSVTWIGQGLEMKGRNASKAAQ